MPDEIVAITTTEGAKRIKQELFDSGVWMKMKSFLNVPENKLQFGASAKHIRLLPSENPNENASDIKSSEDNQQAADSILENLRQFTENPDTKITFSIAGGRKTMSALGALSMSLLGRSHDSLCHVLVNSPFDSPELRPKFYYPELEQFHRLCDNTKILSDKAKISLCNIPFVKLRYLFNTHTKKLPGAFTDTVALTNKAISESFVNWKLELRPDRLECRINEKNIKLSAAEFALYWMLAERKKNGLPPIMGQEALLDSFHGFCADITLERMPEALHCGSFKSKNSDDMRKLVSAIKRKISQALPLCPEIFMPGKERGVYCIDVDEKMIAIS
jgi:CRISPR-associated protein Csx14